METFEVSEFNQLRDVTEGSTCNHVLAFVSPEPNSKIAVGIGCPICKTLLPPDTKLMALRAPKAEVTTGTVAEMIAAINQ